MDIIKTSINKNTLSNKIYLDNAASTPLGAEVRAKMLEAMETLVANPSSIHAEGRKARAAIEQARKKIANIINASVGEIFFTSGATEANNTILKRSVEDLGVERIISSPTEHPGVLNTLKRIKREKEVEIVYLDVDEYGIPILSDLQQQLDNSSKKSLVSLMHVNNETGNMIDFQAVADLCREKNAYFHSDTVQSLGAFTIDVQKTPLSFLCGAAHKFYGPKGIGFFYMNADNIIQPYIDGGGQERNMRAGTENTYGIIGMAAALEKSMQQLDARKEHMLGLKTYLAEALTQMFPEAEVNTHPEKSHYKILNITFPLTERSELLLFNLDIEGFCVSGGSACSSGTNTGSHVLRAFKNPDDERPSIRFSFSHLNTKEEVERLIEVIKKLLS